MEMRSPRMADEMDSIALRPNVIGGLRQDDDFEVVWRDLPIGRIFKPFGEPHWWWGCNVYGQPPVPNDRGAGINFKDCQARLGQNKTHTRRARYCGGQPACRKPRAAIIVVET